MAGSHDPLCFASYMLRAPIWNGAWRMATRAQLNNHIGSQQEKVAFRATSCGLASEAVFGPRRGMQFSARLATDLDAAMAEVGDSGPAP
jgi:hypothetical protein